jgi:Trk-type K+ transport system membrane component
VLLWYLIIAWFVLVGSLSIWIGIRAWRTFQTAKAVQSEIERFQRTAAIDEVPRKLEELRVKTELLNDALDRLNTSTAGLRVLWWALEPLRRYIQFVRGLPTK